jgi:hypothetical protein
MIDRDTALRHHLFEMAKAQRVGHIPAHARQDNIERIVLALKHARYCWIQSLHKASDRSAFERHMIAQRLTATVPHAICDRSKVCLGHSARKPGWLLRSK